MRVTGGAAFAAFTVAWVVCDGLAAQDQQLTDAARRLHRRYPIGWSVAVILTAAHLLDLYRTLGVPECDPYTRAARLARWFIDHVVARS
ncbi:DUF7427 family protein [Nocardia transvalensis]|uniref:DUF7427 family protein n=1 Tax=Nocardia transvalensis TaxID=37333 RepID=UPI001893080F|nr:hypothetical protein [Nocardia transvalensis]MBF6328746.1 hypothetical protein [Nocardia transvalensis]